MADERRDSPYAHEQEISLSRPDGASDETSDIMLASARELGVALDDSPPDTAPDTPPPPAAAEPPAPASDIWAEPSGEAAYAPAFPEPPPYDEEAYEDWDESIPEYAADVGFDFEDDEEDAARPNPRPRPRRRAARRPPPELSPATAKLLDDPDADAGQGEPWDAPTDRDPLPRVERGEAPDLPVTRVLSRTSGAADPTEAPAGPSEGADGAGDDFDSPTASADATSDETDYDALTRAMPRPPEAGAQTGPRPDATRADGGWSNLRATIGSTEEEPLRETVRQGGATDASAPDLPPPASYDDAVSDTPPPPGPATEPEEDGDGMWLSAGPPDDDGASFGVESTLPGDVRNLDRGRGAPDSVLLEEDDLGDVMALTDPASRDAAHRERTPSRRDAFEDEDLPPPPPEADWPEGDLPSVAASGRAHAVGAPPDASNGDWSDEALLDDEDLIDPGEMAGSAEMPSLLAGRADAHDDDGFLHQDDGLRDVLGLSPAERDERRRREQAEARAEPKRRIPLARTSDEDGEEEAAEPDWDIDALASDVRLDVGEEGGDRDPRGDAPDAPEAAAASGPDEDGVRAAQTASAPQPGNADFINVDSSAADPTDADVDQLLAGAFDGEEETEEERRRAPAAAPDDADFATGAVPSTPSDTDADAKDVTGEKDETGENLADLLDHAVDLDGEEAGDLEDGTDIDDLLNAAADDSEPGSGEDTLNVDLPELDLDLDGAKADGGGGESADRGVATASDDETEDRTDALADALSDDDDKAAAQALPDDPNAALGDGEDLDPGDNAELAAELASDFDSSDLGDLDERTAADEAEEGALQPILFGLIPPGHPAYRILTLPKRVLWPIGRRLDRILRWRVLWRWYLTIASVLIIVICLAIWIGAGMDAEQRF